MFTRNEDCTFVGNQSGDLIKLTRSGGNKRTDDYSLISILLRSFPLSDTFLGYAVPSSPSFLPSHFASDWLDE